MTPVCHTCRRAQKARTSFDVPAGVAGMVFVMPKASVRLSAGREAMNDELQALCFLAGANSIFYGEKLLTTGNPDVARDRALMTRLGIGPLIPAGLTANADGVVEAREHHHHETVVEHVHGPGCGHEHAPARPTAACNATRQR